MRIDDMLELSKLQSRTLAFQLNSMKLRSHEFTDVIMFVAGVPENCLSDEVALFASAAEFNRLILSGKRPLISFLYEDEEIDAQALRDVSGLVLAYSSHELYLQGILGVPRNPTHATANLVFIRIGQPRRWVGKYRKPNRRHV